MINGFYLWLCLVEDDDSPNNKDSSRLHFLKQLAHLILRVLPAGPWWCLSASGSSYLGAGSLTNWCSICGSTSCPNLSNPCAIPSSTLRVTGSVSWSTASGSSPAPSSYSQPWVFSQYCPHVQSQHFLNTCIDYAFLGLQKLSLWQLRNFSIL